LRVAEAIMSKYFRDQEKRRAICHYDSIANNEEEEEAEEIYT
jgi:hypothetical protein